MGITQPTVQALERSEVNNTIKLETLRRAAEALDCDLVYGLVPRTNLDEAVRTQARRKAAWHLGPVAHHSRLEDQGVSDSDTAAELDELAARFIDHQGLWSEPKSSA
jgi:predicted DNA-binding mobile mystery protein A